MAVLTANAAVKDDFLRGLDETAAGDGEHQRDVREIYEESRARLLRKEMSEKEFNELMLKCGDRKFARELVERRRSLNDLFGHFHGKASKLGITEEDVREAVKEVKEEERVRKGWK